ncbi:MAG TPA: hypothetical protein VNZ54_09820 [bacterium]|nr:hypothetical protein [bacterium]
MPAFENLRIHMVHGENSKTAAFVSCKILTEAGALFLNSMALVRGANGLYLSFPSRKRDGQPVKGFEDYYYMERGLKELVQATAIEEFKARCAEMGIDAEKASAPLPPGMHGDDEEEREPREMREPQPREYREPPSRQPFRNESRPAAGNGGNGNGGYRGNGGGDFANRGGGGYRGNGGGDFANRGGGGGGYRGNGGGDFANRGGGGYRGNNDYGSNRGGNGGGFRGDDFGNRGGGRGGYDNSNRNSYGFPTGSNLANRPLSSRFNPYTGNNDLQVEKPAPVEGQRKIGQDEEE